MGTYAELLVPVVLVRVSISNSRSPRRPLRACILPSMEGIIRPLDSFVELRYCWLRGGIGSANRLVCFLQVADSAVGEIARETSFTQRSDLKGNRDGGITGRESASIVVEPGTSDATRKLGIFVHLVHSRADGDIAAAIKVEIGSNGEVGKATRIQSAGVGLAQDLRCFLIDDGDADFGRITNKLNLNLHSLGILS